jgi:hypothetical protein
MKFIILGLCLLIGFYSYSQTDIPCYDASKLKNLCMYIGSRMPDPNPVNPKYEYLYERRILEAACVDMVKDSEEEIARKVSHLWDVIGDKMICNNLAFDVKDGSVLKYGLVTLFDQLVYDILKWKINLNKPDVHDGKTLLDYVKFQIERHVGLSAEKKMQIYFRQLRAAGAKFSTELNK